MDDRPLIGRDSELGRLQAALDRSHVSGRAFAIVGEAGIGKTRLLSDFGARAADRGAAVFAGAAAEFEREMPFGVFIDALDPYLASLPRGRLHAVSLEHRAELGAVFPALADLRRSDSTALKEERYRAHRAVFSLLQSLTDARRATVLLLDDLHWADPASLELTAHVLMRGLPRGVVLAWAFRPAGAPELLAAAMSRAIREDACERLALEPLSRSEAEALLSPALPVGPLERDRIYAASGGVPFYLVELARAARSADPGGEHDRAAPGDGVPDVVLVSIAERLAALPGRALLAARAAAVAGEPFTLDLVAAAADQSEPDALIAVDELVAAELARPGVAPIEFRFRHPIVRRAVYESAPPAWRIAAHARVARALGRRGASAAVIAPHVERSAQPGDQDAVALLSTAANAVAARAPATAARWLEAALGLLTADGSADRLALLVPLASALGSSGQLERSSETLEQVVALLPSGGPLRPRVVAFMALIDHLRGRHRAARELLQRTLAELPDGQSEGAASLHFELASERFFVGDWAGMEALAQQGLRIAELLDDPGLRAIGAAQCGLAQYSLGAIAQARARAFEARELLACSERDARLRLDVFDWLGWCELSLEEYAAAREHFERGLQIGRHTGQGHLLATMSFGLVFVHGMLGKLDAAREISDGTVELARLSGSDQLVSWALGMRAWIALRIGAVTEARQIGAEARALDAGVDDNPFSAVCGGWLGEALIEAGEPRRGCAELLSALGGPDLPRVERPFHPYFYEVLTRGELALGRPDEAARWATRATAVLDGVPLSGRRGFARRAEAALALAENRPQAATLAADAIAAAVEAGHRLDAARARILYGRALAAADERDAAVFALRTARDELESCGAQRYRDQAVRELRRLGERVGQGGRRGQAARGLPALSARELEVATLVTERLTNREIAERLVLSEKTIERHLSSVFRKLDAASRVEVARCIERHGAATGPR